MKIKWLGQSGYLLSDGETAICIDPYLSDVVNRIAGRPRMVDAPIRPEDLRADVVICTHNHVDHVDLDAIPRMHKAQMTFCAPSDCAQTLEDLGVTRYVPFDEGAQAAAGGFLLEAVFADHTVPAIGVVITYEGKRLYFTGDTCYNPRLAKVGCDLLFVCINGKLGNMSVEEAVKLTNEIKPKLAIPNHYGMFASNTEDPERFAVPNRLIMEFNQNYEI